MKEKPAMALVEALRSGKFRQTKNKLCGGENTYCCLGVACAISGLGEFKDLGDLGTLYKCGGVRSSMDLVKPIMEYYGFADEIGGRVDGADLSICGKSYKSLANANDSDVTFEDIATYIEKNWRDL